jgi:hypothetical protein
MTTFDVIAHKSSMTKFSIRVSEARPNGDGGQ